MSAATLTPHTGAIAETQPLDFATVYANGYPTTRRRAVRLLGAAAAQDDGLAEQVAQEAWLRVWRHWPDELERQPARVVYAYALRAVATITLDWQRRQTILARLGQVEMTDLVWEYARDKTADPTTLASPEAQTIYRALVDELRATVRGMASQPATRGRAAHLFEALLTDEPQVVTARRLGIHENAIKMSAFRMREALKAYLITAGHADGHTDEQDMREEA